TAIDPAGTAPGLVVPVEDGPTVIVLPGPPPELQALWPVALDAPAARTVLARAVPYTAVRLRVYGLPASEIAATLRDIGTTLDLSPLEITPCLRRGELEIDIRHRPGAEALCAALV